MSLPRQPITVVIPCFNEEDSLPNLAEVLKDLRNKLASQYDIRISFVDDGSTDRTVEVIRNLFTSWPNTTLYQHEQNQGITAAVLTGIRQASTEVVCCIDSDCTYDPRELEHMLPLLEPGVDLVTASPYHRRGRVADVPAWRLLLSRAASFLYRCVLRQKLATYTSCFRVYRRSAVLDVPVRCLRFQGIAELLARMDLRGSRIVEYPTTLHVRKLGQSKMRVARTALGHLALLLRLGLLRFMPDIDHLVSEDITLFWPLRTITLTASPQMERTAA